MPLIHASFTCSKWNMGVIFALKFHILYVHTPCTRKVIFVICLQNLPSYEVKKIFRKRLCTQRDFRNIFSRPLFTIIFWPEMLKFHPYSILTGDTMVGFVIFCVLNKGCTAQLFLYVYPIYKIFFCFLFTGSKKNLPQCSGTTTWMNFWKN